MTRYVVSFLLESLVMGAIIFVFLAFSALFLKTFSAKLRYAIWMVFLAGLLIPMNQLFSGGFIAVPLSYEIRPQYAVSKASLSNESPARENFARESTTAVAERDTSSRRVASPVVIFIIVWGIVAAMIFTYQIWQYFRFVGIIRRWSEPVKNETVLSVFQSVREEKGLGNKKIGLRICEFVSSPLLTGLLTPVVVLPKKHFEADELDLIFRHELIHYKRHDLFVKLLSVITVSIHWFNPIVYWMYVVMQEDGEASCDEAVLQDIGRENKQFYAELMIKMIGGKNIVNTTLSTCYHVGKKSVKRRLDAIMDTTQTLRKPAYAVFIMFAVMTISSSFVFRFTVQGDITSYEPFEATKDIALDRAKEIAVSAVGGGEVARFEIRHDESGKLYHYKIIIVYDGYMYDVDVDGFDGGIKKIETKPIIRVDQNADNAAETIGIDVSSSIAVEIAGGGVVTENRLEYLPREGIQVYHIHVADGQHEYCVKIEVTTGAVHTFEVRHKP